MRTISLKGGTDIPILGFGTWRLDGDMAYRAVSKALEVGYRHIDTALAYGNQPHIARAVSDSGLDRNELFITSKVWRDHLDTEGVERQTDTILEELDTDYVDLLLVHWPNQNFDMSETLHALDGARRSGKARNIGVSNFTVHHLQKALETGVPITVNQIEYHPSLNQESLREFCQENGIAIIGYSPLARGRDLEITEIQNIARQYERSEAQVILNWLLKKDIIAIPKTDNPEHIIDNFQTLDWELKPEDMQRIDGLGLWERTVAPPFAEFSD